MRGRRTAPRVGLEFGLGLRQLDPRHFFARSKVHHGEPVEVGQLREDPLGRAVRAGLDRHRADALVEFHFPSDLLGRETDHGNNSGSDRACHDVFAVRRDIDIMQSAVDRNALGPDQRHRIDDIERTGVAGNADYNAAVFGHSDIVWMCTKRHLLHKFTGLAIENIERGVGFVADVHPGTVRRKRYPVGTLDTFDHLHHLVGGGIDHVDAVSGAVGDVDAGRTRPCWNRCQRQHKAHMSE